MARITVEDCLKKIKSQYDLVLLAKERTAQLNAGGESLVTKDNDKNTVISLREIGEGKVSIKTLEDAAINKLRVQREETQEAEEFDDEKGDDFEKLYKGEVSKSGTSILPSKRVRRVPEKFNIAPATEEKKIENEEPVNEEPVNEEPVNEEPVNEEPVNEDVVQEDETNSTPEEKKSEE